MPDSLFGPPIIRAKTLNEQLADWFTGRKYDQDPGPLSALAALVAPLTSLMPGPGKAAMLPNLRPVADRNIRTAMEYLGDRAVMHPKIDLRGDYALNGDILDHAWEMENKINPVTFMRRVNPDLVEASQRTVRREGVRDYVEQAANGGNFAGFDPVRVPGTYNPFLYKIGNRFIAGDGHHRTSANTLLGKPSLSEILDVDMLTRKFREQQGDEDPALKGLLGLLARFRGE